MVARRSIKTYSWKKCAMAIRDCNSRFMFSSALRESWKVLGSILGNRRNANGRANSARGMIKNMENGTRRNKSETVRSNCFLSRLVNADPDKVRLMRSRAVLISAMRS